MQMQVFSHIIEDYWFFCEFALLMLAYPVIQNTNFWEIYPSDFDKLKFVGKVVKVVAYDLINDF